MNDLIDRQAAIEAAIEAADKWSGDYNYERQLIIEEGLARVPSAEKRGRWISIRGWVHCSVCHKEPPNESNIESDYCPNCGARMGESE